MAYNLISEGTDTGLSTDLVIEPARMRTIIITGGLTRGRGMEESQRVQWVLPNGPMQEFTGSTYASSDQHKDVYEASQIGDITVWLKPNLKYSNKSYAVNHQHCSSYQDS